MRYVSSSATRQQAAVEVLYQSPDGRAFTSLAPLINVRPLPCPCLSSSPCASHAPPPEHCHCHEHWCSEHATHVLLGMPAQPHSQPHSQPTVSLSVSWHSIAAHLEPIHEFIETFSCVIYKRTVYCILQANCRIFLCIPHVLC